MVVPVIGKEEWASRLGALPAFAMSDAPMLVIAPHPDDETLALGGLIASARARDVEVTVVAVTDGEHAYAQNYGLAERRREEQTSALSVLGVPHSHVVRMGLVDSGVAAQEEELVERLLQLITLNTQIVAPWHGDFHPDHEACARAARRVADLTGAELVSYFFWTWHRGTPESLEKIALERFPLSEELLATKLKALSCHASQLHHASEPPILPDDLLWPARMPFEVFAR